jgi:hypothetical protein
MHSLILKAELVLSSSIHKILGVAHDAQKMGEKERAIKCERRKSFAENCVMNFFPSLVLWSRWRVFSFFLLLCLRWHFFGMRMGWCESGLVVMRWGEVYGCIARKLRFIFEPSKSIS